MPSKTRYPELSYHNPFPGLWRIVAEGRDVGPHYPTRVELLADLDRFAADYGCEGAVNPSDTLRAQLAAVEAERDALRAALAEIASLEPSGIIGPSVEQCKRIAHAALAGL